MDACLIYLEVMTIVWVCHLQGNRVLNVGPGEREFDMLDY